MDKTIGEFIKPKFGFRCESKLRHIPILEDFERDLLALPTSIEFGNVAKNVVQEDLNKFIRNTGLRLPKGTSLTFINLHFKEITSSWVKICLIAY